MCRLFGQISVQSKSAQDFLASSEYSLLRQSNHRPLSLQKDGWGIAYFNGRVPTDSKGSGTSSRYRSVGRGARVVKSPAPIFKEAARFIREASLIRSHIIVGHIRAASNPRGLPAKRLISRANSQPFTNGRIIFAHNGTLEIPLEVAKFLGAYRRNIRGVNDSEVYFWQFMKFYDAYGNIPEALQGCIRETWLIWESCKHRYPDKKKPYTGLNTLIGDGRSLHALCHYPQSPNGSVSIFNPKQPWGTMSLTRRRGRIIFASENMDSKKWQRLAQPEIASATLEQGCLKLVRRRFHPRES